MKNKAILASLALALCCASNLAAQKYPAEDADGGKIYYKIASAYPEYSQKCIEYQTPASTSAGYYFVVSDMADGNEAQEWEIVAAAEGDSAHYYLRNRRSRRYIGTTGVWKGNFLTPDPATVRSNTSALTIADLNDGQISIRYTDNGSDRYFFAADSAAEARPAFNRFAMENSVWAWKVCTASGTPVSVPQLLKDNAAVRVSVVNRVVKVEGADSYSLYNDEGMRIAKGAVLSPGIYFVSVGGVSHKILVK